MHPERRAIGQGVLNQTQRHEYSSKYRHYEPPVRRAGDARLRLEEGGK